MRRNYDPADRDRLLQALLQRRLDGETFEQICATPGWPTRPTLRRWLLPDGARTARDLRRHGRAADDRFRHHRWDRYDLAAAEELIRRVRWGEPLRDLLREPHLPQRRALTVWKTTHPDFAAQLAAAKAAADRDRRDSPRRRARPRMGDEALQDRIVLALLRGATLPSLYADRSFPSRLGFRRWRRADPEFDRIIAGACRIGHKARGRSRAEAACTPSITESIERHIVDGHSLNSLVALQGMPSNTTLYKWVRTRPAFARAVAIACEFRDDRYADEVCALAEDHQTWDHPTAAALRQRLGQLNPTRARGAATEASADPSLP